MEREYDVSIWMPLFCDKYLLDTEEMSGAEAKAYSRIMVRLWKAGGYLPSNPKYLCRIAGCSHNYFEKIWKIICKYFENNYEKISQPWMLRELEKAKQHKEFTTQRAKRAAKARWDKAKPDATSNATSNARGGNGTGIGNLEVGNKGFTEKDIEDFISGVDLK